MSAAMIIRAVPLLPQAPEGCGLSDPMQCVDDVVSLPGQLLGSVAGDAWTEVCKSFADACTAVLQEFAKAFEEFPGPDYAAITAPYGISLTLGMIAAFILLMVQVIATAWSRSGTPLGNGLAGLAKAALACVATLEVAQEASAAADQITGWIISANAKSVSDFDMQLAQLVAWNPGAPAVVLLLCGLIGILLTLVLWFELLLRNAALAVLVASAPIAAAGQVGSSTQDWWRRLVRAGAQLTILKPVIALIFAIAFPMVSHASTTTGAMSGLLVLVLAVFAWPLVGRFFTFTGSAVAGGMALGAVAGAAANRAGGGSGGMDPGALASFSEGRSMAAAASRSGGAVGGSGGGGGAAGGAAKAGMAAAGVAGAALAGLQKTVNAIGSRMEQMAGHAGMEGANPTAYPAGFPNGGGRRRSSSPSGSPPAEGGEGAGPAVPPPAGPPMAAAADVQSGATPPQTGA